MVLREHPEHPLHGVKNADCRAGEWMYAETVDEGAARLELQRLDAARRERRRRDVSW